MTEAERHGLRAALAQLEHGFTDYGEAILRDCCGRAGAAPIRLLREAGPLRAMQAIREALSDDA